MIFFDEIINDEIEVFYLEDSELRSASVPSRRELYTEAQQILKVLGLEDHHVSIMAGYRLPSCYDFQNNLVYLNSNDFGRYDWRHTLAHELRHYYQHYNYHLLGVELGYRPIDGTNFLIYSGLWMGEFYQIPITSQEDYATKLPWEKDANDFADAYLYTQYGIANEAA